MVGPLIIPSFVAGLLTFLAPCTLPLLPAYLSFVSGVSIKKVRDGKLSKEDRRAIALNGVLYSAGFTVVFVGLGLLAGYGGSFIVQYRDVLSRIGGVLVIFFGLFILFGERFSFLSKLASVKRLNLKHLEPGTPLSAFLFGAAFAIGWTPCVGPILGSVLFLATNSSTIWSGGLLLLMFSLGLALPFVFMSFAFGYALQLLKRIEKYLKIFSAIGGVILIVLGLLLVLDKFGYWVSWFYSLFGNSLEERLLPFL